jgi:acyl-CoA thioesterase I
VSNLPSIVFLGDSLTAGRGLEESEALPALIQQRLDASKRNYRAINGGRSGDTSKSGLSRLDWYLRDAVNLSVLVVGLGSNDAMRGLPVGELEVNLRTIIQKTRAARPSVKILLWELHTFPNMGADYSAAYAAVFPRVAAEAGVELIPFPLQDVAGLAELNQDDGIHPSAEGTRKVAERIWQALEAKL